MGEAVAVPFRSIHQLANFHFFFFYSSLVCFIRARFLLRDFEFVCVSLPENLNFDDLSVISDIFYFNALRVLADL